MWAMVSISVWPQDVGGAARALQGFFNQGYNNNQGYIMFSPSNGFLGLWVSRSPVGLKVPSVPIFVNIGWIE